MAFRGGSLPDSSHLCWQCRYPRLQQSCIAQPRRPTRKGEVRQGTSTQMELFIEFSSMGSGISWWVCSMQLARLSPNHSSHFSPASSSGWEAAFCAVSL